MLNFEYFDATGSAVADGVFIPVAALPGLTADELATGDADKASKAILALVNTIYDVVSPGGFNKLGFALTKANPTGTGDNLISQNYSVNIQYQVDHGANTLSQIPVPTAGTSQDIGKFAIADVFPTAVKVAAAASTGGAGILIPSADLAAYGAPAHASVNPATGQDNRDWFAALFNYLAIDAPLRTADTASALTARTRGSAAAFTLPATYTQATNPISGILTDDLGQLSFFSQSYSFTIQLSLNQGTQTFDVNHATT